jgi:hypothetical protein
MLRRERIRGHVGKREKYGAVAKYTFALLDANLKDVTM